MQKLFVDYDGVIVNTIKAICEMYDEDYWQHEDYRYINWAYIESWDFTELNCAKPEEIDKYFDEPRFFEKVEFMPWVEFFLEKLNKYYDIYIISMGHTNNLLLKEEWCAKNIPYAKFIGANFDEHVNKSKFDMRDGVFIDDVVENLNTSNAIKRICFGDQYEWNKNWKGLRCANWADVWKMIGEPRAIEEKNKIRSLLYG